MNEFLTKSIIGGVKDIDVKNRIVTGYLSSFGNKDYHDDIIEKGAFKKSIAERKEKIRFLAHHNWQMPLSKFAVLQEDAKGLYFESEPLVETSYAVDLMKLYDAGVINEHSIGYSVVKDNYDAKSDTRHLTELKLYEGSAVTLGANSETPFTGFKCANVKDANEKAKNILRVLHKGDVTDEMMITLEIALKQLMQESYELGKKSLEIDEPKLITHKDNVEPIEDNKLIINEFLKSLK
jgi:hypothetical protein